VEEDSDGLELTCSPTIGVFVFSYLELGLELGVTYAESSVDREGSPSASSLGVTILPLVVRGHLPVTDHFFLTAGMLLGYGRTETETSYHGDSTSELADGFVLAGEVGFEIAVDNIVVPVWVRPTYRPWKLTEEDSGGESDEMDAEDFVLGFGVGVGSYF
jgi:hypothetical protein